MGTYVLILYLYTGYSPSLAAHAFSGKAACEKAGAETYQAFNTLLNQAHYVCVEK